MSWSDTPVNGQQSVAANKTPINQAFTYISTTEKKDHYWDNANANLDGRHQFVQMPNFSSSTPTIGTDMKGVFYVRAKTVASAPDLQMTEPFFVSSDGTRSQVTQMGCRAMLTFRVSGGAIVQNGGNDWDYKHNIATVVRNSAGSFTITFTTQMPTDRYIICGTCRVTTIATETRALSIIPRNKLVTSFTFSTSGVGGSADPDSVDLIVLGG